MRLSEIPARLAAMAGQHILQQGDQGGAGRRRVMPDEARTLPYAQSATSRGYAAAGGLGLSAGDGPDAGPAPAAPKSPGPRNPALRLMQSRDKDAAIKEENAIASVQDKRVAEFFRVRPELALAFGVSPDRELGIARRAMANINIVNESVRADFMSNAMIQPEEKKSAKEFRWKKTRTMEGLVDILKTAPDVHTALGVTPDADAEGAAIGNAKAQLGGIGKNDLTVLAKAAPRKEPPPLPEWKLEAKEEVGDPDPENDRDDSPRPF